MYDKIHLDLFSGIGGFALAADRVFGDVEHIFCDIEPFAQAVLKKHWPQSPIYSDIRSLTYADWSGRRAPRSKALPHGTADSEERQHALAESRRPHLLTGGFPCQPFSQAGRRRGEEDDRFLWPEMLRVIREFSPLWVIAENVRGLLTQGGGVVFERVCTDLEVAGYEVQPIIIPAVAVGAPHRRDRVWFVGHAKHDGRDGAEDTEGDTTRGDDDATRENELRESEGANSLRQDAPDTRSISEGDENRRGVSETREGTSRHSEGCRDWGQNWLEVATRLCRVDDGIPRRMDRNPRLKALGNAIVPQVAEEIMRAIKGS